MTIRRLEGSFHQVTNARWTLIPDATLRMSDEGAVCRQRGLSWWGRVSG